MLQRNAPKFSIFILCIRKPTYFSFRATLFTFIGKILKLHEIKNKIDTRDIAKLEAFCWNISLRRNLFISKGVNVLIFKIMSEAYFNRNKKNPSQNLSFSF